MPWSKERKLHFEQVAGQLECLSEFVSICFEVSPPAGLSELLVGKSYISSEVVPVKSIPHKNDTMQSCPNVSSASSRTSHACTHPETAINYVQQRWMGRAMKRPPMRCSYAMVLQAILKGGSW